MDTVSTRKISAIISSEHRVERVFNKLTQTTVARHDITIQGDPSAIADKFGTKYVEPDVVQRSQDAPKKEPYLEDDFGWLMGFAFSIPMFIGIVIGIFIIGDVRSLTDNLIFGVLGAIVGGAVGYLLSRLITLSRKKAHRKQENQGGFVIWVTITNEDQINEVIDILKNYGATNIKVE
ncbi:Uncharacterised protein [Legionella beliardensis]|uniref:Transmembrane protein n=1 Tax=Legionella beliardensis TaxID=91822 RepID=A0A378I157_9GAMM|nr:hypothetical protein [Legionella beliardensis]STX28336.1 Uncharacterised protein [Legionella beliardensis]